MGVVAIRVKRRFCHEGRDKAGMKGKMKGLVRERERTKPDNLLSVSVCMPLFPFLFVVATLHVHFDFNCFT